MDRGHGRLDVTSSRPCRPPLIVARCSARQQVFLVDRYSYGMDGNLLGAVAVLGITSLPPDLAGPGDLLAVPTRRHWAIEMHHYVRSPGVGLAVASCGAARHGCRLAADLLGVVLVAGRCSHGKHEIGDHKVRAFMVRLPSGVGTGRCWMRNWLSCRSRIRSAAGAVRPGRRGIDDEGVCGRRRAVPAVVRPVGPELGGRCRAARPVHDLAGARGTGGPVPGAAERPSWLARGFRRSARRGGSTRCWPLSGG